MEQKEYMNIVNKRPYHAQAISKLEFKSVYSNVFENKKSF